MRIAVFLPNWIGDVVMATPAILALRRRHPEAQLVAVARPYVADVLEGAPWFHETVFLDRTLSSMFRCARRLRRGRPDLAVLFPNSWRPAAAAWLGRCRHRIGFARSGRQWLLTTALMPATDAGGRRIPSPIIDDYNRLAVAAGAAPDRRLRLFTESDDESAADRVWAAAGWSESDPVVCLNPGAAFGSSKYWSVESFANVAWRFAAQGFGVLVLCGPAERDMARQIARQAGVHGVRSLADESVSIGLTKACVRRCDLLVTTDSGPRHFAAAFDRPVVTLFGPTHMDWTRTFFAKEVALQKSVPCGPCQLRTCPLDHRCMTLLTPGEVFSAGVALLARFPTGSEVRHAG